MMILRRDTGALRLPLVAPTKDVVAKIQTDVAKVLQLPDVREKLTGIGVDAVGSTPAELAAAIKTDYDRYGAIIRKLGIKAD